VGGDFDRLEDWLAFSEILHAASLIVGRRGGRCETPARRPGLPTFVYGTPSAINSGTLRISRFSS